MQQTYRKRKSWIILCGAAAALLLWKWRALVFLAARHLFWGWVIALAALPLMKRLERRMKKGPAAALSIAALNAVWAVGLFLVLPALVRQFRYLAAMLPGLWQNVEAGMAGLQQWFSRHGVQGLNLGLQSALVSRAREAVTAAVPALIGKLGDAAGSLGQWLMAPVFGFYFLRDRKAIAAWIQTLLPESGWQTGLQLFREIRRETAGYLRGQLMVCAMVGALTAVGLLVCGIPAWLPLGLWMGVLEVFPYVGPVIGGASAVVFALPMGLWRTLCTLGIVLMVQALEGCMIAPRLISQTTRLHPALILLCILLGGSAAGVTGILLAVPVVLCLRAAVRVLVRRGNGQN